VSSLADHWPPSAVRLGEGDLALSVVGDDDIPGLVDLALAGVHPPDEMPFAIPWTQADPAVLPAQNVRYYAGVRAGFTPESFNLLFAVRWRGELVGLQGIGAESFAVLRSCHTGSWLGLRWHGQGVGTRMRRAVCAFAFDELGAIEVRSAAFFDNPASLAVSRKVGYRPNGTDRLVRAGVPALNQRLVLTPDTFVRGAPLTVTGAAGLRSFLGLG
jgi:RimJ/RimL family protein N-acetyltransferase